MEFKQLNHFPIYEMCISSNRIEPKSYRRVSSAHVWDDLWTNPDQYDSTVKPQNKGASINGIYSRQGWIDDPIVPSPVVMFGWFDLLERTEFPSNTIHWNIVSARILEIMNACGVHPKLHRIRVVERTGFGNVYGLDVRHYEHSESLAGLTYRDDWFYGIQLPLSQYALDDGGSDLQTTADHDPLPAFFALPGSPGRIFLSREARDALQTAGIQGVRFDGSFSLTAIANQPSQESQAK